ncbi:hypothetical protein MSAN_00264300 [Mycena sanguinolenta]|uniref:F-box domain-containing protein n=1 Tax=Mycena sanguinolenta TaxID=230812 RepID=A0A8H6ZMX5_9AGAR|nr:hypothetical protein MSAN_00264300 [Mycena sanguinolenta]
MQDLPSELIDQILDAFVVPLRILTDHGSDRKTLLSCSLVSWRWSTQSQRLLFRRVVLSDPETLPLTVASFLRTITADTDKSRSLRESVLSILLCSQSSTKSSDTLALITNLPNLRELNIMAVYVACDFTDAELLRLRNTGPSIRSLRVETRLATWPAVVRLIAAIPTLRMLDVATSGFGGFSHLPPLHPPIELGLVLFKFGSTSTTDVAPFLAFLIDDRTDNDRLEVFYHRNTGSARGVLLKDVLSIHSPHLRSIFVPETPADSDTLSLCTRLERFECESLPSRALVATIPRTITTLAIKDQNRGTEGTYMIQEAEFYKTNKLPCVGYLTEQLHTFPVLRRIIWHESARDDYHDRDALQDRFTELGIEMLFAPVLDFEPDDEVEFSWRHRLLRV